MLFMHDISSALEAVEVFNHFEYSVSKCCKNVHENLSHHNLGKEIGQLISKYTAKINQVLQV